MTQDILPTYDEAATSSTSPPRRSSTLNSSATARLSDPAEASTSTPSPGKTRKPLGPRSPIRADSLPSSPSKRERAGSSRTTFVTSPVSSSSPRYPDASSTIPPLMTTAPLVHPEPESAGMEDGPHAPYRDPEVVMEAPEEQPPGYVPGVVEEHPDDDDMMPPGSPIRTADPTMVKAQVDSWQADVRPYNDSGMDVDVMDQPVIRFQRPQIGYGGTLRYLLAEIHVHDLFQQDIKTPSRISTTKDGKTDEEAEAATLRKIWSAAPGGEAGHMDWFFCPTCWAWMRIRHGQTDAELQALDSIHPTLTLEDPVEQEARSQELTRIALLRESRSTADINDPDHYHVFRTILPREDGERLERVPVDNAKYMDFPAVLSDLDEMGPTSSQAGALPLLYMSCTSQQWFIVDPMVPGQIPRQLANRLTDERNANPRVGSVGHDTLEAWELLANNVLFKGEHKWLKLESAAMTNKLGRTETVALLLYCLGFGCKYEQKEDAHRAGPFQKRAEASPEPDESTKAVMTDDQLAHMDKYMMRTWLEIETYISAYMTRNGDAEQRHWAAVTVTRPSAIWEGGARLSFGYPDSVRASLGILGVTKVDTAARIIAAYRLQCACDEESRPKYLSALCEIAEPDVRGKEDLQLQVSLERSMGHFTLQELEYAYEAIGYNAQHVEEIGIDPSEAPDDYILQLHKKAVQTAQNSSTKTRIYEALNLIGRSRRSDAIMHIANSGETIISVQEAYEALSCPLDAVDDGLIMQYEMAVSEYPGKTEHYRKCLEAIADAPGAERPGLKQFLGTGTLGPPAPPRKDIPVGLQNIGNTCYLNSILQYLYSIKPLRDAVIDFEQNTTGPLVPVKPDIERSKRFVRQLRLLFMQLYGSAGTSVRPDEELAYLAITRPEVDAIVEPAPDTIKPGKVTLDTIPDMPSPTLSSTDIGSIRGMSPDTTETPEEVEQIEDAESRANALGGDAASTSADRSGRSILGKRASQDRESSGSSNDDRHRLKSESRISESELVESPFMETAPSFPALDRAKLDSMGPVSTLADLHLKSTPSSPSLRDAQTERPDPMSSVVEGDLLGMEEEPSTAKPIQEPSGKVGQDTDMDEDFVMYEPPSNPPPLPARPIARRASTLASGLKFGLQQDSAEVLINVLSQLELAFDPPKAEEGAVQRKNLISELFSCTYRQQMFVQSADGSEERRTPVESVFVHPIIGVEEEGKDLYDCLAELYLSGSEIEYEGKKGYIMDHMERFPPLLYIQMRFDMATGRERKTNTHIPFGQTLAMDRFLSTADPEKREKSMTLTREMTRLRARLHELKDRKPLAMPATFAHAYQALQQFKDQPEHGITEDFLAALRAEGEGMEAEIADMGTCLVGCKQELDDLWRGENEYEYELVSVFMHRGKTSGAGHYWTYQAYLPEHGDRFFKYNDELVTEVPATEVLEDRTGSDANPALLCYVRKGQDLVHTLHRRILEDAGETGQGEVQAVPPIEGEQAPRDEPVEGTKDDVVMESQGYNSNAQSLNYL